MLEFLKLANLGFAFLLELCVLAGMSYWGFHTGSGTALKIGLGFAAPVLTAIFWGVFVSPKALMPVPAPWHLVLQVLVFGLAALALVAADQPVLAGILAAAFIVNQVLIAVWKQ
jgi:quinol-cytochrome oxidoreductase complex cytochrome b subunit